MPANAERLTILLVSKHGMRSPICAYLAQDNTSKKGLEQGVNELQQAWFTSLIGMEDPINLPQLMQKLTEMRDKDLRMNQEHTFDLSLPTSTSENEL